MAKKKRSRAIGRFASLNGEATTREFDEGQEVIQAEINEIAKYVGHELEPKTKAAAIAAAEVTADTIDRGIVMMLAMTHERLACVAGCNFCCQTPTGVLVPEIARIVDHAERNFDPEVLDRVRSRAQVNAEKTHGKHKNDYPRHLPCALLGEDGHCLAYDVRPVTCRFAHSRSIEQCKKDQDPPQPVLEMLVAGELTLVGAATGIRAVTGDGMLYELQEALHIALSTPDAVERWLAGDNVFSSAQIESEPVTVWESINTRDAQN
ncbi:MAG: hypothetical protein FWD69_07380 [Polyangiaceae bacterium]|nr:hypothetical protein [Polyangiaceae bacterium]